MRPSVVAVITAAVTLAVPAAAAAHVTLQPPEAPAGAFTVLAVRVPNEQDGATTKKVQVQMPDGILSASTEPVPGWTAKVTTRKLDPPLKIGGIKVAQQVDQVVFTATGKGVEPGQFQDFPVSMKLPDGKAGDALTFKALQTYSNGDIVRWIGAEDTDNPAPTVMLTTAEDTHAAAAHGAGGDPSATTTTAASSTGGSGDDGGSGNGLAIVALIVGAAGVLVGAAGFATARKAVAST